MSALRFNSTPDPRVTDFDLVMMERAIALAGEAAALDEVPVGAVVYRGDEVIAEGYNVRESAHDPVGHAELLAIARAGKALGAWRLAGCSLAVTLEPCPMCAGALVNARIERVLYGATDPKAGACDTLYQIPSDPRLNHEVEVIGGVLAERCGALLTEFFRRKRQRPATEDGDE